MLSSECLFVGCPTQTTLGRYFVKSWTVTLKYVSPFMTFNKGNLSDIFFTHGIQGCFFQTQVGSAVGKTSLCYFSSSNLLHILMHFLWMRSRDLSSGSGCLWWSTPTAHNQAWHRMGVQHWCFDQTGRQLHQKRIWYGGWNRNLYEGKAELISWIPMYLFPWLIFRRKKQTPTLKCRYSKTKRDIVKGPTGKIVVTHDKNWVTEKSDFLAKMRRLGPIFG